MTATVTQAAVSVADLLDDVAPYIHGVGRLDVAVHLRGACRRIVAGRLGLDLGSDHGHRLAYALVSAMLTVIEEHLRFHGHRPGRGGVDYPVLADWLIGRPIVEVRAEIDDAAAWWRSMETPGRLL